MKVVVDGLWLCSDCTQVACNGPRGMDISPEDLVRVEAGLAKLGRHLVPDFDSETGDGLETFSKRRCDSCDSSLAGYHARFVILGEEVEQ